MHQAVQPPRTGGATAWAAGLGGATAQAISSSGTGRCNRPSQEVQPPRAQSPSETGRCNLLCQEVAPPELKFRALPRGATTELGLRALAERCNLFGQEMHRLSSVFELWQRGATTSGREVHQPELSFELCQVMHLSARARRLSSVVAPPGRARSLSSVVAPPGRARNLRSGGATS